jgi:hypothetical protein
LDRDRPVHPESWNVSLSGIEARCIGSVNRLSIDSVSCCAFSFQSRFYNAPVLGQRSTEIPASFLPGLVLRIVKRRIGAIPWGVDRKVQNLPIVHSIVKILPIMPIHKFQLYSIT